MGRMLLLGLALALTGTSGAPYRDETASDSRLQKRSATEGFRQGDSSGTEAKLVALLSGQAAAKHDDAASGDVTAPGDAAVPQIASCLADGATFSSPGFVAGDYYHDWIDAYWYLEGAEGQIASVQIVYFALEKTLTHHTSYACLYDYVNFYAGHQMEDCGLIKSLCGDFPPEKVYSTNHQLLIHFHTDSSYSERGFQMIAHVIEQDDVADQKTSECTTEVTELRVDGNGRRHVYSPGYGLSSNDRSPGYYWPHAHCNWKVLGFPGTNLKVEFVYFSIESSLNCDKDNVTLRFPFFENDHKEVTLCGRDEPPTFVAYGNEMEVSFNSDCCGEGAGFLIVFTSTDETPDLHPDATDPCPGPFYVDVSHNPAYPTIVQSSMIGDYTPGVHHYGNGRHCQWVLTAGPGRHIHYAVQELTMEESPECSQDVLQLFRGVYPSGYSINLCGTMEDNMPEMYAGVVEDNAVNLRFVTDFAYDVGQWVISFHSVLPETATTEGTTEATTEAAPPCQSDERAEEDMEKLAEERAEDQRAVALADIQALKTELDKLVAMERTLKQRERLNERTTGI